MTEFETQVAEVFEVLLQDTDADEPQIERCAVRTAAAINQIVRLDLPAHLRDAIRADALGRLRGEP